MKKLFSVLLCAAMVLTLAVFASAELIDKAPEYSYDFQKDYITEGYKLSTTYGDGNDFREIWTPADGLGQDQSVFHVENGGNKYLTINGFMSVPCDYSWKSGFNFSADISGSNPNFCGVLFNSANTRSGFTLFENNGAAADGDSLVGDSGIGISLRSANKLEVYVLTLEGEKIGALRQYVETSKDLNGFNNIEFCDNGNDKIEIKLNGAKIFTVSYADPGKYETDKYSTEFYKTVHIYGSDDKEVASSQSALISTGKTVGFGTRAATLNIDNIKISPVKDDTASSTLKLDKKEYSIVDGKFTITAEFTGAKTFDSWFGVYPATVTAPGPSDSLGTWCYANGTRTPGEGVPADGKVVLNESICNDISKLPDGDYKVIMFARDTGGNAYEVIAVAEFSFVPYKAPATGDIAAIAAVIAVVSLGAGITINVKRAKSAL